MKSRETIKKLQIYIAHEYGHENPYHNISKEILAIYKKDYTQ